MSSEAIAARKEQMKAYFDNAPDSVRIYILTESGGVPTDDEIYGFFVANYSITGGRRQDRFHTRKRNYQIQTYSGYAEKLTENIYVSIDDVEYKVVDDLPDLSPGTFQAIVQLTKVNKSARG